MQTTFFWRDREPFRDRIRRPRTRCLTISAGPKNRDYPMMRLLSRREWMFLAFIFIFSFVPTFAGMVRVVELLTGWAVMPENPRAVASPLPIVLHVLSSFLFCLLGGLQFVPGLRHRHVRVHRKLGKTIAAAGGLSALTGLWMTLVFTFPEELQGVLLYWVRIVLSVSMIGLIAWAVVAVRSGNASGHGAAMLRAYAIGQGASTQAFLGLGWMAVTDSELTGPWRDVMMVSAWGINLLVAELLISKLAFFKPVAARALRPTLPLISEGR